jgi:hypothetical protein
MEVDRDFSIRAIVYVIPFSNNYSALALADKLPVAQ